MPRARPRAVEPEEEEDGIAPLDISELLPKMLTAGLGEKAGPIYHRWRWSLVFERALGEQLRRGRPIDTASVAEAAGVADLAYEEEKKRKLPL